MQNHQAVTQYKYCKIMAIKSSVDFLQQHLSNLIVMEIDVYMGIQ